MTMNSPLHIGILAPDLNDRHGWSRYSSGVLRALRQTGARLTVIAARDTEAFEGMAVHPLLPKVDPMDRGMLPRQLAVLPRVRGLLDGCNVIHSLIEPYAPLAARMPGNRPLFVTGHGSYVRANQMRRPPASWVYTAAFRQATMICVSNYTARAAREAIPGIRTAVIGNGVSFERFSSIRHIGGGNTPTVLFVGMVKARKGVVELVRAMRQVRERIPNVCCRIIGSVEGEPDYADQVRAAIREYDLSATVKLEGRIPDDALMDAYARADVFVLPSVNVGWKFEGFGLTLLEASAAGLPVIGTRDCGAEDAVIDGVTGLLVSQTDLEVDLASAILKLFDDRAAALKMGEAGRDYAQTQSWDRVAERLMTLYREGIGG